MISNKINILFIALLTILGTVCLFGFSYYSGINSYWTKTLNNSYDYDLVLVNYDENILSKDDVKTEIFKNNSVKDVFFYNEFMWWGQLPQYNNKFFDGQIHMVGTVANTKKIITGNDLSSNKYEIICPNNFFPGTIMNNNYNIKNTIDLSDKVGSTIEIAYLGQELIEFKLIGLFDISYDFTEPNYCYVNHETLNELNDIYQPELDLGDYFFVLLNDIDKQNNLSNYDGVSDIIQVKTLKKDVGNKVLAITGFSVGILIIISVVLGSLIFTRRLMSEYKNIGIMMLVGYTNKDIKNLKYIEVIYITLISFCLSILFAYLIARNYVNMFLWNDPQLSLISINITTLSILITLSLISITMIGTTFIVLKKIDELEVCEVINE